mgnify:CR=1 FL=1
MSEEKTPVAKNPSWMPKTIGLAVILIVGAVVAMTQAKDVDDLAEVPVTATPDPVTGETVAVASAAVDASYKDGVYSTTGNYDSPAGPETIDVTLTIKDGLVEDASVQANATNAVSVKLQGVFVEGYKALVIGKKLSDLSLPKVSGSSLTPKGFNDALDEIRTQASV